MPVGKSGSTRAMTLGYRTLYVWFEDDDILVTVQTNSQPTTTSTTSTTRPQRVHAALKEP